LTARSGEHDLAMTIRKQLVEATADPSTWVEDADVKEHRNT
jgi:hypothetical protein